MTSLREQIKALDSLQCSNTAIYQTLQFELLKAIVNRLEPEPETPETASDL